MFVSRLQLSNIRCFVAADLSFSPAVNLIVGANNSGKSTLIRILGALQSFGLGTESVRYGTNVGNYSITIANGDGERFAPGLRDFIRDRPLTSPVVVSGVLNVAGSSHAMTVQKTGANGGFTPFANTQPDNFLVPYLSDRRVAGYSEVITEAAAYSVGGLLNVVAKIDTCLSSRTLRPLYEAACHDVLGFVASTWPTGAGKMAGLEVDAVKRRYIPLERMGAGVGQSLGLIVELLVSQNKLFLIEELENDLHPAALRTLLGLVERSAKENENQFVLSTHSNVVVRTLGSIENTRLWQTHQRADVLPPQSDVIEVPNKARARHHLLETLGYDLSDYDLYDAWLILEESSAERIIREFIIPWFAPRLAGRLRTVAAQGAQDVPVKFADLHRLFVFTHLEPIYREKAWVVTDGDDTGCAAVEELRRKFPGWPADHFQYFPQEDFERYYPPEFSHRVLAALALPHGEPKQRAKGQLVEAVVAWLRENPERGGHALQQSAGDVIAVLRAIEESVTKA